MDEPTFQKRVKSICQMLFEMATGNLAFRLQPSEKNDDLDKLAQLLNTFAAQMRLAIKKSGYAVPHYTCRNLTQLAFVLDLDFTIASFNFEVTTTLQHRPEELFLSGFGSVLSEESEALWQKIRAEAAAYPNYHGTVHLIFITADRHYFPAFCTVSRLLFSDKIFISSVTSNLKELAELNRSAAAVQKPTDAAVIQSLYYYILDNLEKPLPTLKQLAVLFQTNEFKLKQGFRHFFKTSIYRFYNEGRLDRAHLLIQQSDMALKAIALTCGFNDYITFLKAFKKRFGYAPGKVRRDPGQ